MDKFIIIGGKGSAIVVAEQIYDAQLRGEKVEMLGFAFDDESFGDKIAGFPILCKTYDVFEKFKDDNDVKFIFQLYRPDLMKERIDLLQSYGIPIERFGTFIHPSAIVSRSVKIGYGTVVLANCVVNSQSQLGNFCTLHSNVLIGHDTIVGDYNFIAAHNVIGSSTEIGAANFFGLNSSTNNYIKIGDFCFIAMASNVIKSIDNGMKVKGNPAKPFESNIKAL